MLSYQRIDGFDNNCKITLVPIASEFIMNRAMLEGNIVDPIWPTLAREKKLLTLTIKRQVTSGPTVTQCRYDYMKEGRLQLTFPFTDWMGSTTTATALSDKASKLCCVLISTPDSQHPKPGWEWYHPTTISGLPVCFNISNIFVWNTGSTASTLTPYNISADFTGSHKIELAVINSNVLQLLLSCYLPSQVATYHLPSGQR